MRVVRLVLGLSVALGAIIALVTTIIAFGYLLKILAVLLAVIGIVALFLFLVWAAIYEYVIMPKKKPP